MDKAEKWMQRAAAKKMKTGNGIEFIDLAISNL